MKRFGGILLAVELYTFDHFLGVFWSFFLKKQGGVVNSPGFDQISLNLEGGSFGRTPSNGPSFIEIGWMACAAPAWSFRGCTLKHLNTGTPRPNDSLWTTQVQIWHWYPCLLKNSLQWQQYICWRPIRRFDNLYLQRARKPHHVVVQSLLKDMLCNLKNLRIALVLRINQYYRIAESHVNILWYQYHK